jgi:hypothetical protein
MLNTHLKVPRISWRRFNVISRKRFRSTPHTVDQFDRRLGGPLLEIHGVGFGIRPRSQNFSHTFPSNVFRKHLRIPPEMIQAAYLSGFPGSFETTHRAERIPTLRRGYEAVKAETDSEVDLRTLYPLCGFASASEALDAVASAYPGRLLMLSNFTMSSRRRPSIGKRSASIKRSPAMPDE